MAVGANQPVSRLEAVVQAVVDVPELEQLNIGELDHLKGIGTIRVDDKSGRPVEHHEIGGRIRERQPGSLADLVLAQRLGFEADQARDPVSVVLQPPGARLAELEDDVLLAHRAHRKVIDRRAQPLDPGAKKLTCGLIERGRLGERTGQLQEPGGRR